MDFSGTLPAQLTIVIPAYNEAISLQKNLPDWLVFCDAKGWELIIVNDGSVDETRTILEDFSEHPSFRFFNHKLNRGYGGALKTGLIHARTRYVVTMDADGQHNISDVAVLYDQMLEKNADLVIGRRTGPVQSRYRELGKAIIRFIARWVGEVNVHDLNSGFKLYRTDLVNSYLDICPDSMAFSDIIVLVFAYRRRLIIEHPIEILFRQSGQSTISTRTALDTVLEIINIIMLFNPMKIFIPVAISCLVFGVLWGLPIVLSGRGVSVGAMLAIVTGLLLFFMGVLAEQLARMRLERLNDRNDDQDLNLGAD